MIEDLHGRVAVVTGAASGIGLALAERLAAEGMRVAMADVERGALADASAAVAATGADVLAVATDVSNGDEVDALRDAVLDRFGAVDLVCNNAGVGGGGTMWELTTADWAWVLGVNLWGVIHGIRAFVPLLVDQGHGHVVNTASMAGLTSPPFMGPYNASKHAVVTISETLHGELAMLGAGVGVSVLCPGWVNTRIADSDRNRPPEPGGGPAPATGAAATGGSAGPAVFRDVLRAHLAAGMDPATVAGDVVDAVRTGRFYVLTHEDWAPMVQARVAGIVAGSPPPNAFFPPS